MLSGSTPGSELAGHSATMTSLAVAPVVMADTVVVHALFELRYAGRAEMLPPGLHPTNPPTATVVAWQVNASPWGTFSTAFVRIGCRSGVRPRGLSTRMVVDSPEAAAALASGWGFPTTVAEVDIDRRYDATTLKVVIDGAVVLDLVATGGTPLSRPDFQLTDTLNLAHTPNGLRLVQTENTVDLDEVERLAARVISFDASWWGQPRLDPYHPVAAVAGRGAVRLPALRYLCRPDELAFTGTETVPHDPGTETVPHDPGTETVPHDPGTETVPHDPGRSHA